MSRRRILVSILSAAFALVLVAQDAQAKHRKRCRRQTACCHASYVYQTDCCQRVRYKSKYRRACCNHMVYVQPQFTQTVCCNAAPTCCNPAPICCTAQPAAAPIIEEPMMPKKEPNEEMATLPRK